MRVAEVLGFTWYDDGKEPRLTYKEWQTLEDWKRRMTKVGTKGLKMSSGKVKHFGSEKKRDNFERVAQAYKHGWRPKNKKRK